jgi:putative SOS response-associated peptidase YedK
MASSRTSLDNSEAWFRRPFIGKLVIIPADHAQMVHQLGRRLPLDDSRPLFFFAGIWTPLFGRWGTKAAPIEGEHKLFGFHTTDSNR